mmetsp:Transcript_20578/g.28760  ORF Transcript_20578/g.28760 Transcript_20578/m.28760 type:complete len:168 (-) Transcript_20578:309-812(-)|eukprot:CAMPEP_0184478376 /NCGR_PEP_ID=MMETSP0113_2-20130426/425_1 /TAXON_ID=91329 /ORGANISM="Norrisiella sphaerica, Strain BC52" /LENGTH=167 /DNA_ID=CAMNT_0026856145 /DNA_START=106 /DNA_END=609 /DNA_ORIENTATION=+
MAFSLDDMVDWLRDNDVNQFSKIIEQDLTYKGYTILMMIGMHSDGTHMVRELLRRFPNQINRRSTDPLEDFAGDIGLIADADILRDSGYSPLMLAVMFGPPASVKAFLDAGADTESKTKHGSSVLEFAQYRDDDQIRQLFKLKKEAADGDPGAAPCQCNQLNSCTVL